MSLKNKTILFIKSQILLNFIELGFYIITYYLLLEKRLKVNKEPMANNTEAMIVTKP